jgi:5-methylcytosine-specific restriction endonuclease McrA
MKRKGFSGVSRNNSEPQPRPFVRLAHFESLRTLRRKEPELYISMSAGVKAQLELYCDMRRVHESRERAEKRKQMIDERGAFCACCGDIYYPALTIDHITPRSRGGSSQPGNIQVLCLTCNGLKGSEREACPHVEVVRRLMLEYVSAA